LECPISYHISCIPPFAKFHELATLCHEHSDRSHLPHLELKDSLQAQIENKIDEKLGELIKKDYQRNRKKRIGQNPFIPNVCGTALTSTEADVLVALQNGSTNEKMSHDDIWFCLPCDMKEEVHSKPATYKHVHSLQYSPSHKPPRIPPQDDACSCVKVCDERCINRLLYTECYGNNNNNDKDTLKNGMGKSSNCAIGGKCGNRQLGQRLSAKCKPRREHGKGWGWY
jgi:hypothetical protein